MTQQLQPVVGQSNGYHDRRRKEPRTTCDRAIALLPCASEDPAHFMKAKLSDCSPHGLGLVLSQKIDAGQQVLARVELDRQPVLLMYTIRYCIPTQTDEFRAGARFSGFVASKFRSDTDAVVQSLTAA